VSRIVLLIRRIIFANASLLLIRCIVQIFLNFQLGFYYRVGTKNRKYGEGKISGGLESSQSSGQTVGCPVMLSGF
jgi:hypothetical protein